MATQVPLIPSSSIDHFSAVDLATASGWPRDSKKIPKHPHIARLLIDRPCVFIHGGCEYDSRKDTTISGRLIVD
jgi:hypothetical protein